MFVRGPCGARRPTWPYGHHTKPVRAFRSAESKDPFYWTRTSTVRSFIIRTDSLRPVWFGGLFPAYSIMSLSQCKIYWLNDSMLCAVKRVNDNMPSAHNALMRGP